MVSKLTTRGATRLPLEIKTSLAERKAQAEKRILDNSRMGLEPVREEIKGRDVLHVANGMKSSNKRAWDWTKTDGKASEYVWRDVGGKPALVRREDLEWNPALFGLNAIQPAPMVQRKPRTDGKKVFADYRKQRSPVVVVKR